MADAFFIGMGWPGLYKNADGCKDAVSDLLDDFFFLRKNHTGALTQIERVFNVTAMVSNSYRNTMYECFNLHQQIQESFVVQTDSFVDDNDLYTSFLFNLLAESIQIREYSYDLIDYSAAGDFVSYTQSFAGIIGSTIYFKSSTASSLDPNDDDSSPYIQDKSGQIMLRDEYEDFVSQYNKTLYRDMFFTVEKVAETALTPTTPVVRQTDDELEEGEEEEGYKITVFTFIQFFFGFINGALNALPVGGFLYFCGKDLESQRVKLVAMWDYYQERKLTLAVEEAYIALAYVNAISINCYFGALEYFTLETLTTLY